MLAESQDDLIQQYSFTDADLALIGASDTRPPDPVVSRIAKQVRSDAGAWPEYGEREKTRNERAE